MDGYTHILANPANDGTFEAMRFKFRGMSSPRTAKLLNFAVGCMTKDECYVEIGTFTGYTLLSAQLENSRHVIGIDNFALWLCSEGKTVAPYELLKSNVNRYAQGVTSVLAQDFREAKLVDDKKVGVFFIDGEHTYKDVIESFAWAEPYLADQAIIVLDDTNATGVTEAMRDWIRDHPAYEEIFYCKTAPSKNEGTKMDWLFHNGIAIVRYQRA